MEQSKKFSYPVKVYETDIDQLGHANNVVYLRWAQEAAEAHWMSLTDEKTRNEMIWVVLRHEIDYKKSALVNESLTLYTWVGQTEGVRSIRYVEICNAEGIVLASVQTTWCLVDPHNLRPKRIPEQIKKLFITD